MLQFLHRYIGTALVILLLIFVLMGISSIAFPFPENIIYKTIDTQNYKMTDIPVKNPFMGYAVNADYKSAAIDHTLVYIDITFKELQPESPDKFNFSEIEKENNIALWKKQEKHAVLRFVCDFPTDESHSDIPQWLMEITGDGTFYDTAYGKGYSPDYNNEIFIRYHKKAIEALAEYFDDGFVSYVELGSLGHWGEWHIKSSEKIVPLPKEKVRETYVNHYVSSFKNAKLLMRRPFKDVKKHSLGIYNDMLGAAEDTDAWLDWIKHGGTYSQTGEKNSLTACPDFWEKAPSGGEFTSSVPMQKLLREDFDKTLRMLRDSHTTFIGPNIPVGSKFAGNTDYDRATTKILSTIGYRLGISHSTLGQSRISGRGQLKLTWENDGVAPIYFNLPVNLYTKNENGEFEKISPINIDLCKILPGETIRTVTPVPAALIRNNAPLYVGITDPMTNEAAVSLVSNQEKEHGYFRVY